MGRTKKGQKNIYKKFGFSAEKERRGLGGIQK